MATSAAGQTTGVAVGVPVRVMGAGRRVRGCSATVAAAGGAVGVGGGGAENGAGEDGAADRAKSGMPVMIIGRRGVGARREGGFVGSIVCRFEFEKGDGCMGW